MLLYFPESTIQSAFFVSSLLSASPSSHAAFTRSESSIRRERHNDTERSRVPFPFIHFLPWTKNEVRDAQDKDEPRYWFGLLWIHLPVLLTSSCLFLFLNSVCWASSSRLWHSELFDCSNFFPPQPVISHLSLDFTVSLTYSDIQCCAGRLTFGQSLTLARVFSFFYFFLNLNDR